ncbi:site-specific integrase [Zhongshania marina]|uniref:site-specific integrase n=1 Tax=Zhongshania marina TaxID=2304603 RepID=UPI001E5EF7C9|nr:site-specific integrase [Marortus luteolus]
MERSRREDVSVEALKEAGLRQNTLRAADGAVRHFEQTFGGLLPASPTAMADYIAFSLEEGLAVSTVGQRVSLLGTWHEEMGYPNPNQGSLVKTVLKGARSRYRKAPKKAVPLSRDHLVRIVQACDDAIIAAAQFDDPKQSLAQTRSAGRDKAFFLLGFWCAFRSDELVNLRWEYLTFGEGRDAKTGRTIRTLEVFLPASKGDRSAEGRSWALHEMSELCPVTALFDLQAEMMADEGPVFVKIGRWGHAGERPLHINSVLELMKRAIARAGLDAAGFSTHSLRRGFANHAIDRNTDVRDLMDWVKWKDIRSAVAYLEANQRLANTLAEIDQDMPPKVSVLKPERLLSDGQSNPIVAVPFSDRVLILNARIEKNNGAVPDSAVQLIRQDIERGVLAKLKLVKKDGAEYHFMSPMDLDSAEFADWAEELIHEIVETVDEAGCWCEPELWRKADHQEYGREWVGPSIGWASGGRD